MCPNEVARFAGQAGIDGYFWSNGGDNGVVEIQEAGSYTLSFDNGLCSAQSAAIELEEVDPVQPVIEYNGSSVYVANINGTDWQWFLDGDPIEGANNAGILTDLTGTFTVQVTDFNGCTLFSEPFEITLSVANSDENGGVNIYPVPARDVVTIEFPSATGDASIQVFSVDGRTIEQFSINTAISKRQEVHIGSWAPGAYIVQLISGTKVRTGRIVKMK